jgi:hypothetical protein
MTGVGWRAFGFLEVERRSAFANPGQSRCCLERNGLPEWVDAVRARHWRGNALTFSSLAGVVHVSSRLRYHVFAPHGPNARLLLGSRRAYGAFKLFALLDDFDPRA